MSVRPSPRLERLARVLLAAALVTAAAVGCGGGVGSGGTGVFASGPISGFGSIIVNGVRYDESAASVTDDDDATRDRTELKLGMTVTIDADPIASDAGGVRSAAARSVRIGSEIVGPVGAVDRSAGTFTVLGQTVRVAVDTVFDERIVAGLQGLAVGQAVEVYGLYDASSGRYDATRIERPSSPAEWLLRGPVATLDTRGRVLGVGGASFAYGSASGIPPDLAVGQTVRLRLATAPDGGGRYAVTRFGTALRAPEDRDAGELEGLVGALLSSTSFSVGGLTVDASLAQFPDGRALLRPGARVKVTGSVSGGVLRAAVVEIQTEQALGQRGFELKGMVGSVDAASRTFTLRNQAISWARPDLQLQGGTLADLKPGRRVEVKAQPGPDRTLLEATRIVFD